MSGRYGAACGPDPERFRQGWPSRQVAASADRCVTQGLEHIDGDGYLYIEGRADDVHHAGGFKIDTETVVRAMRTHDAVRKTPQG